MRTEPFRYIFKYIIALILTRPISFDIIDITLKVCQILPIISPLNGAVDIQTEPM